MFTKPIARLRAAPWRTVCKTAAWFTAGMTLLVGVPSAVYELQTHPETATPLVEVALFFLAAAVLAMYGVAVFTLIWVTRDVPAGWASTKQFIRDFPSNWHAFWSAIGSFFVTAARFLVAAVRFLLGFPGLARCGFLAAFDFAATLPVRWRALPSREKAARITFISMLATMGGIGYFLWPFAASLVAALPAWLVTDSHHWFVFTAMLDMLLSVLVTVLLITVVRLVLELATTLFRRPKTS